LSSKSNKADSVDELETFSNCRGGACIGRRNWIVQKFAKRASRCCSR